MLSALILQHWLAVHLGCDHSVGPSVYYNCWSGFGSTLQQDIQMPAAFALIYWHHNCHKKWCLRWGRHPVDGTPHKTCRRHHPTLRNSSPTMEEIQADHEAANPHLYPQSTA